MDLRLVYFLDCNKAPMFKISPLALAVKLFLICTFFFLLQISGSISPKSTGYPWLPYNSFTYKFTFSLQPDKFHLQDYVNNKVNQFQF